MRATLVLCCSSLLSATITVAGLTYNGSVCVGLVEFALRNSTNVQFLEQLLEVTQVVV
jgi:hypothetical protein